MTRENGDVSFLRRLFRRRQRRVDVGHYVGPARLTLAPVEAVVDEGVLISAYSVRLALKNRLIVEALRDHNDFDVGHLKQVAHERLLTLADENAATAERLDAVGEYQQKSRDRDGRADGVTVTETGDIMGGSKAIRLFEHRRRPEVHRRLADALRQRALEENFLDDQVEEARQAAWAEVSRELVRHATQPHSYVPDDVAEYAEHRDERLRALIDDDLGALAQHGG